MIEGISHLTFVVKDLDRAAHFFQSIFDAERIYASCDKTFSLSKEQFFLINDIWIAIMEGVPPQETSYHHVAFKVAPSEFQTYLDRVKKLGVKIKEPRSRIIGEAESLYFYDYDNHLFEIHTGNLEDRLRAHEKSTT